MRFAAHSYAASNDNGSSAHRAGYLERENDDMVSGLREKVAAVKSVSIQARQQFLPFPNKICCFSQLSLNIGEEIRHHNKILRDMDSDFESSSSVLNRAMKRVKIISRAGYSKHFLYLILFAFVVFVLIYVMYKFK